MDQSNLLKGFVAVVLSFLLLTGCGSQNVQSPDTAKNQEPESMQEIQPQEEQNKKSQQGDKGGESRREEQGQDSGLTENDKKSGQDVQTAEFQQEGERIGEERAKQIALERAGISEADAQRLKVEYDNDDGRAEYEVEWDVGQTEYDCDVDAYTGEILSYKEDID